MDSDSNERRRHRRHKLVCPITLFGRDGQLLASASTADLSHGGMYLTVAPDSIGQADSLNVAFSIPDTADRSMEGFAASAKVIRQEPSEDTDRIGLALQFTRQMHLPIET